MISGMHDYRKWKSRSLEVEMVTDELMTLYKPDRYIHNAVVYVRNYVHI
jgi:hypothetical protein